MSKKNSAIALALAAVVVALIVMKILHRDSKGATVTATTIHVAVPTASTASREASGIDGVVLDAKGAPVAHATIRAVGRGDNAQRGDVLAGVRVADERGEFSIDVAAGEYVVTASNVGAAPGSAVVAVNPSSRSRVSLKLGAAAPTIKGHVTDMNGGPVVGALIVAAPAPGILSADDEHAVATTSDASGAYAMSAPMGRYLISAMHPDYVGVNRSVEVGVDGVTVDLSLAPGSSVEGVVLDGDHPVPAATIDYHREVTRVGMMQGVVASSTDEGETIADRDGHFRITGLGGGRIVLAAHTMDGRTTPGPTEIDLGIADTKSDIKLRVVARPFITGRVVYLDGKPAARANLSVNSGRNMTTATAGDDGNFQLTGLSVGHYVITAHADDSLSSDPVQVDVAANAGATAPIIIKIARGQFVTGHVEPAEAADVFEVVAPPDGMAVDPESLHELVAGLRGAQIRAGNDGSFRLGPLAPGKHTLGARAADGRHGQVEVEVPTTADVAIKLEAKGIIAGHVVAADGKPLVGVTVSIAKAQAAGHKSIMLVNGLDASAERVPVDDKGYFEIAGREPGDWNLSVLDERSGALALHGDAAATSQLATLPADAPRVDVTLTVDKPDGELHGRVIDKSGSVVADAWVTIEWADDSDAMHGGKGPPSGDGPQSTMVMESYGGGARAGSIPSVLTAGDGTFAFTGLRKGHYSVTAEANRGNSRGTLPSVATGSDASVTVVALATIAGVVTSGGKPVTDFSITATGPMTKDIDVYALDGSYAIAGLNPGVYTVEVHTDSGSGRTSTTVAEGQTATANIAIAQDGTVTGSIVDSKGAPLANVMVVAGPRQAPGTMSVTLHAEPPKTDATGHFTVTTEAGLHTLLVMPTATNGVIQQDFELKDGETLDLGKLIAPAPGKH